MFLSIDRLVLSQIEKGTQFLQRYFGIKISTVASFFAIVNATCICTNWYYKGFFNPIKITLDGLLLIFFFLYVFFISKSHQDLADQCAAQGVSNPFKVNLLYTFLRLLIGLYLIFELIIFFRTEISVVRLVSLMDILSYFFYTYTLFVDVLPPSSSKEGSWLKNLFQKRSLST